MPDEPMWLLALCFYMQHDYLDGMGWDGKMYRKHLEESQSYHTGDTGIPYPY